MQWTPYTKDNEKVLGIVKGGRKMIDLPIRENELPWVDKDLEKV